MSVTNPKSLDEQVAFITQASSLVALTRIKQVVANNDGFGPDQVRLILETAQTLEVRSQNQRPSVRQALRNALKKLPHLSSNPPAKVVSKQEFLSIAQTTMSTKPEITTDHPKDPRFDQVRETAAQMTFAGRAFLRCQVKLGMLLSALKKEIGRPEGRPSKNSPESGKFLPWADLVKQQTGYSRQSCDEFIRLWQATQAKLKKAKKIDLPPAAKKDCLVIFQSENPLALTDAQWQLVDEVIGSLTKGETQASLLQELGIISKPKGMPTKDGNQTRSQSDATAGQLAFHFFDAVAAPLVNARSNPSYKKMLYGLPLESDEANPLSIRSLKAEFKAALADLEEAEQKALKASPAKGRVITI